MVRKKKTSWKNVLLNVLAVCLTITPIFSVGAWALSTIKGDGRQLIDMAVIEETPEFRLFEEPLISVTFDDGWESIYTNGAPILSEYDIVTTRYILPSHFGSPAYFSISQARHMRELGHEIASHTYTHATLTKVNLKTVEKELKLSHDILVANNLADQNMNFAPPNGAYSLETTDFTRQFYGSQRNVAANLEDGVSEQDVNLKTRFDRYNIIGYTVGPYTTLEQLKQAIEYTKKHNGWLVLVYHQIETDFQTEDGTASYNVTPDDFRLHMQLVKESKITTVTVMDVMDGYRKNS